MTKILRNICVLFTYGLIDYYECLVIVLSMSRWNCLEVMVHERFKKTSTICNNNHSKISVILIAL